MHLRFAVPNPLSLCLVSAGVLCSGLSLAGAQTPTQPAPATQTTSPAAPPAAPPSTAPVLSPGTQTATPAALPNTPQVGLAPGIGQSGTAAPALGGTLPLEPAPLTPEQIIGVNAAPGAPETPAGSVISLDEALKRARANEPAFAIAVANAKNAGLDKSIARAGLLPTVIAHNQYLFTTSAGTTTLIGNEQVSSPSFIANNGVHEYITQASVTETIGLNSLLALSRANALAAVAKAQEELSRRGLNATVISLFYAASLAQGKVAIQQRALAEANNFLQVTRDRETAREAAHADVLKAELTQQQRQRDVADAQLAAEKAKLDLGVLLFADPATAYRVVLPAASAPPAESEVKAQAAAEKSPQISSASAALTAQNYALGTAEAAYLPLLSLNYAYGIDSNTYAVNGRDGARNLGYSVSATVDIPVFDWLATPNKIRQAHNLRDAAKVTLGAAQRTQMAQTQEFFNEVKTAYTQLDSLRQTVAIAQESLHLTRLRYTSGEATVLEVVDAENTLATSEIALNDGTTRYQLALANLQILTGTI